ncbi:MAG: hypothetical protein GY719_28895 [bacterium]|nr:hypothetical protein [bacterium]
MNQLEERIRQIDEGESAERLLHDHLSAATVRAVAQRANEIRLNDPKASLEIASAALEALSRLPRKQRRPRLVALAWAVYGSSCRAMANFEEAEIALTWAARIVPRDDDRARADIAHRLAVLRADQRQEGEARRLMGAALATSRRAGGRWHGQELVSASGVLMSLGDFDVASRYLEQALNLLPPNGDRFHLAAVYNFARCRLELATTGQELHQVGALVREAARLADPGSLYDLLLVWMNGNLLRRLGRYEESRQALELAREQIDQCSDGFNSALLLLDLAELHLERGAPESARQLALSSFATLQALRDEPDAYRAMMVLYHSALDSALDLPTVQTVRSALLDARA